MDLRAALSVPTVYRAFVNLIVGDYRYVVTLAGMHPGERVLDLGCGPADLVEFLPDGVDYTGVDISEEYIAAARQRFGTRARFIRAALKDVARDERGSFDLVLGHGVLHHVDDAEAAAAFATAAELLKPHGRMFTIDPCFTDELSRLARWLVGKDRGQFVRTPAAYQALARSCFPIVEGEIRHDLLRIPWTHFIMRSRRRQ